ncbi:hypothetical protein [Paraburkholderia sp. BCC1884]|uniref:hypothetical protein n=1 Tax=Paraburkholderia sp. BCC1884 TaxID=2562668 RepID=UPI0021B3EEAD|nr:hypothetical protein [Paraburkholderia sp. BCC1884]
MNPTRSFPNAQPMPMREPSEPHEPRAPHGGHGGRESPAASSRNGLRRTHGLLATAAVCVLSCVALAGCDGGSGGGNSTTTANNAAAGAGGASAAVPIVAAPASGACAAAGASAAQPLQNTQLVCAP